MKKLLSLMLALAVVLSSMSFAFAAAPTDVAGTTYESAVARLSALGILKGYPDGTFKPDNTITRAEFAQVVIASLGYGAAAQAAQGQTKFSDVAADYWATGAINMAASLGILNGYPDGTFQPNKPVSYQEAVKMVVSALGYDPAAKAKGGYPSGYLAVAAEEDITEGAVYATTAPATRGIVAKMVDNSLEVDMMGQVTYGTETRYEKNGKNLLADYLKLDVRKGTISKIDDRKLKVKLNSDAKNGDDKNKLLFYNAFETLPLAGLEDADVTLWVKDGVAYNIKIDSTIFYDYIAEVNGADTNTSVTHSAITDIKFKNLDDTYDVILDSSENPNADYVYNFAAANSGTQNLIGDFAKVVLTDGKISKVESYDTTNDGLVTKVATDKITYTKGVTENSFIRNLNDTDELVVVIDGKAASLSDIKDGMYIESYITGKKFAIVASSATKTGKLAKAKTDKLMIGDAYTDLASNWYASTDNGGEYKSKDTGKISDLIGLDVTAYLNAKGQVAYVKGEATSTTTSFYGVVQNWDSFSNKVKVARNVDGEKKDITYETDLSSTDPINDVSALTKHASSFAIGSVYKFSINKDNVVTKIEAITASSLSAVEFNNDGDSIDQGSTRIYPDDDTAIIGIKGSDVEVYKWSDIKGADVTTTSAIDAYYDDATPDYVILDLDSSALALSDIGNTDYYFGYVSNYEQTGSETYEYTVNTTAGEKTFSVDKDDRNGAGAADFVAYKLNSDGTGKIQATTTYAALSTVAAVDSDWDSVALTTATAVSVDDNTITAGGTTYELADNAVVYKVDTSKAVDDYDAYDIQSLSDIQEGSDQVTFILVKGRIAYLFFHE